MIGRLGHVVYWAFAGLALCVAAFGVVVLLTTGNESRWLAFVLVEIFAAGLGLTGLGARYVLAGGPMRAAHTPGRYLSVRDPEL